MAAGAQKTKLEKRRLGRIYLQRLRRCRRHFQEWLCANGISLDPGSAEPAVLDAVLARYLDAAHQCGLPVYLPKHAVLDIQCERRELRHRLPRTWDSIRAWESIVGWRPRPPMTEAIMLNCFLKALDLGMSVGGEAGYLWTLCACLWRAGFYGLLRPGEILRAHVSDFVLQPQVGGRFRRCLVHSRPQK